jgi:hypothetical protein
LNVCVSGLSTGGFTELDDDTYRTIIRAKIAANHWDGTTETLSDVYQIISPTGKRRFSPSITSI